MFGGALDGLAHEEEELHCGLHLLKRRLLQVAQHSHQALPNELEDDVGQAQHLILEDGEDQLPEVVECVLHVSVRLWRVEAVPVGKLDRVKRNHEHASERRQLLRRVAAGRNAFQELQVEQHERDSDFCDAKGAVLEEAEADVNELL